MDTKIKNTLTKWFPNAFTSFSGIDDASDYEVLNFFVQYTLDLLKTEQIDQCKEIFKIINLLYTNGPLHDRNAIENEFLAILGCAETPSQLKVLIDMMPKDLRAAYLKTILEN
ncbi:MAG: hypothetical protein A2W91_20635 [Bacteroidetes bacterium GWF2_38_335]|nr:MAG: hypothetical protein A2W91_20635 [Bacteroidetes bacterium GWF2_38_335]OFY80756.1 MAG: hypothetical protein A2281_17070 [Bacteroidetes bacterium RIFOXYA12_FULL_38_20]HBS89040.1 hypothetical protein [Bacteroidales bacterium]